MQISKNTWPATCYSDALTGANEICRRYGTNVQNFGRRHTLEFRTLEGTSRYFFLVQLPLNSRTDKWLNIPTEFRLKVIELENDVPLVAHWGVWYRYLELGRQKSGVGATIGRFGSRYGKKIAKNDVFFRFWVPNGQKKKKWYRKSFNLPLLYHWSALEGTSRYFLWVHLPLNSKNRWFRRHFWLWAIFLGSI